MEAEDSAKLIREYIVAIKTILPVRSRMLDRKICYIGRDYFIDNFSIYCYEQAFVSCSRHVFSAAVG